MVFHGSNRLLGIVYHMVVLCRVEDAAQGVKDSAAVVEEKARDARD